MVAVAGQREEIEEHGENWRFSRPLHSSPISAARSKFPSRNSTPRTILPFERTAVAITDGNGNVVERHVFDGLGNAGIDSPLDFTGWFRTAAEEESISTPYGIEAQSASAEAQSALAQARNGAALYRTGRLGTSMGAESPYWSLTDVPPEFDASQGHLRP